MSESFEDAVDSDVLMFGYVHQLVAWPAGCARMKVNIASDDLARVVEERTA
jgi:hypothetical protein